MQTFLPYPDFECSAYCLDWRRLGKQRVEAMQILNILTKKTDKPGWRNHPAVKMWKGYEDALGAYMNICIDEWIDRGYNNTMKHYDVPDTYELPPWFGREDFHSKHRAKLLGKDLDWYSQYGWVEEPLGVNDPYIWE